MSKDEARVLVRTYSDRSMGAYYYCDLTSGQVQKLAEVSPWLDEEDMSSMQPVQFQSRDGLTLLVAQGANDPRVKKAESDQIVQALEKRGIDVQYMVKKNEGHGFANEENQFEFYRTMEIFLGQHLGSKVDNRAA
jgi:dienelactone hydrolase